MVLTEVPAGVWPMITGSSWRYICIMVITRIIMTITGPAHRAVHLMWVVAGDEEENVLTDCLTVHVLIAHLGFGEMFV